MADVNPSPLAPAENARLIEFARACKAAARVVLLYPEGHPAIAATLGRIAQLTSSSSLPAPLKLTVLPDSLRLDDRAPARQDPAIGELAALLHSHSIGELTVRPDGDIEAWRSFLLLLGRSPDPIRAEGGIARVWTTMAGRHVEIREIDYSEVLRERGGGHSAAWERVLASCLQGSTFDLDEEAILELLGIAGDQDRLAELIAAVDQSVDATAGLTATTAALMRMLRRVLETVSTRDPDHVEPALRNMAGAVGQLSPEVLIGLFDQAGDRDQGGPRLMDAVVSRMSDGTIARFVSRNVVAESTATDRLAQAFQSLVQDAEQRPRLLALAKEDVAASPLGSTEGFEAVWDHVAEKLLKSYSDESYVSEEYGRELSGARMHAIEVEEVSDDPPERLSAWLGTVATSALRMLDLTLLLDLLRIEADDERWGELMTPVIKLLEDQLLVGDFDSARQLIAVLVQDRAEGPVARRQHAINAIDSLIAGSMMHHVAAHLATIDDAQFDRVKAMCISLGEVLVRPIAEALSTEDRPRPRERLTAILIAFGAVGRRTVERLKSSQNPAVRRTAIYLLREFGGSEALPDLTELLGDNEAQVQREAVRAILNIGTDEAYRILQKALAGGTDRSREAIMQSISSVRDERAAPLFTYILRHVDHRGPLSGVYLRAIESLGALRDPQGVESLKESLYKGEWWAPRRTAALRTAAAAALARIGTPEALAALDEAASSRLRGVRAAARVQLLRARRATGTDAGAV